MKFKVGDRVRVKSFKVLKPIIDKNSIMVKEGKWLFLYEYPDGKKNELYFTEDMLCFCGQSAKSNISFKSGFTLLSCFI